MSKKLIITRNYKDWDGPQKWMLRLQGENERVKSQMVLTGPVEFVQTVYRDDFTTESGFGCTIVGVCEVEQDSPPQFMAITMNDMEILELDIDRSCFTVNGQEVDRVASLLLLPDGKMYCQPIESVDLTSVQKLLVSEPAKEADTLALISTKPAS